MIDEVDRMLDMGFKDIVDEIISFVYCDERHPQTLSFSATMPEWINDIVRKYLADDAERIDLIEKTGVKVVTAVQHFALQCSWREGNGAIADCIRVYSSS